MENYAIEFNNELYHHGIKGQKWGERNAEWYPIDEYNGAKKRGTLGTGISSAIRTATKKHQAKKIENKIKTADMKYIRKHPEQFTKAQINKALERKQQLDTVSAASRAEKQQKQAEKAQKKEAKAAAKQEAKKEAARTEQQKVQQGKDFIDSIQKIGNAIGTINTLANNSINLYNNVARVQNFMAKEGDKKMPPIPSLNLNDNQKKDDQNK